MKSRQIVANTLVLAMTLGLMSLPLAGAESTTPASGKWDGLLRGILNEALQGKSPSTPPPAETPTSEAESPSAETPSVQPPVSEEPLAGDYDELKAENEQLQRQISVLRDMKFQETMRRIEGLNMRKGEIERNIGFLEAEKTELTKHMEYLEKQLKAYQGVPQSEGEESEKTESTPSEDKAGQ